MNLLELAQSYGLSLNKVASTNGGEYKGPCPKCGGNKRFWIQPYKQGKRCVGSYACRECGISGDTISFEIDVLNRDEREVLRKYSNNHELPYRKTKTILSLVRTEKVKFTPQKTDNPVDVWVSKATKFVDWAHNHIKTNTEIITYLEKRGINQDVINTFKIGWNPQEFYRNKSEWGLTDDGKKLWLPKGIVIPCFRHGTITRIKIRRTEWQENDALGKYINIAGNKRGLSIFGNSNNPIMLVVESELDAIVLSNLISEKGFSISVGSNTTNPDQVTHYLASNKTELFICHDNDEGGLIMLLKWQKLYPHAKALPTPIGKDIGEAIERGFDIRSWLKNIITPIEEQESNSDQEEILLSASIQPSTEDPIVDTKEEWSFDELCLITWWKNLNKDFLPNGRLILSANEIVDDSSFFYEQIENEISKLLKKIPIKKDVLIKNLINFKNYMERSI